MTGKVRVLACMILLLYYQVALAANSVGWASGNPVPSSGKISASGTSTTDTGWTPSKVSVTVAPTGGGEAVGLTGPLKADGTWGPIDFTGLPAGQYSVSAAITFTKSGSTPQTKVTPLAIINVP